MMDKEKTPAESDCDNGTNHEAGNVIGERIESEVIHKYKKRKGTSIMMIGSRYKTNLITLILYRSLINKMDFILGCNVDDVGGMGEICYRFNHESKDKPVLIFIKTKFQDNITDRDLNNANSDLYLLKCFQNFLLIHDRLRSETDPLLKGNVNDVELCIVVYGPKSCLIKNRIAVSDTDKIFHSLNILSDDDTINRLFQIKNETFVDVNKIYEEIEHIGKTIAAYVTSADKDVEKVNEEMINTFIQYHNYLLPDVIKISDPNGDCYGEISDTLLKSDDKYHKKLKEVLFKHVRKKVIKAENYEKQILLLLQGDTTTLIADGLSINDNDEPVIFDIFVFDELNNKLVLKSDMPLEFIQGKIEEGLNKIKVTKAIMEAALDIATEKTLKSIRILITSKLNNTITQLLTDTKTVSDLQNQINKAKFLNSLYIYTAQKNLVTQLEEEIGENQMVDTNASIFQPTPDLLYLQLHNKVQKWWFLQDHPYYLTNNNCDFLEMGTVVSFSHLSVLNLRCVNELEGYSLQFKELSTDLFKNVGDSPSRDITNIVTNDVLISSIKLMQFINRFNRSNKRWSFVDFEHVSRMKYSDCEILLEELSKTNIDTFVIVMYKTAKNKLGRLQQIVEKFNNQIVIVSKIELTDIGTNNIIRDDSNSLADIENGDDILEYKIIVQGTEDELKNIIDGTMKHLIKAEILSKVIKQEKIEVGNKLADPLYEEIKDYYAERKIRNDNSNTDAYEKQLSVFLDIEKPVVTIIAPPGMGKSKLLTHLSVQTKKRFPHIWIIRMNLLDYAEDFFKWDKNKTSNVLKKSMDLVCKAEVGNDDHFSLEERDGVLVLTNIKLEATELLHLELVIDLFNKGYIYFIFDGFDEICPDYEMQTIEFMKNIVDWNKNNFFGNSHSSFARDDLSKREIKRNAVWITSRPYNDIQLTLMNEFSTSDDEQNSCINLKHLTKDEQALFYHKYWKDHIKIETFSKEQFCNIDAFFEYMDQFRQTGDLLLKTLTTSIVPLRLMHEAAVDYFRSNISSASIDIDEEALLKKWISKDELQTLDKCIFEKRDLCSRRYEDGLKLAGTPLHMQIYADLFVSEIMGTSSGLNWEPDVHSFEFYERFLETKFKKQFQEKGGEDVHSSSRKCLYEDEKEMFTLKHKWLAFYSFFHDSRTYWKFIPKKGWNATRNLISSIKKGEEKTGLIDRVNSDGMPHFVHLVFAEYFAVECIADLLKMANDITHMSMINHFIFNIVFSVSEEIMTIFDHKLKNDEKLRNKLTEKNSKKFMFNAMIREHSRNVLKSNSLRYSGHYYPGGKSTLKKLLMNESKNTVEILMQSIKDNLNSGNIITFIDYIGRDFFVLALKFEGLIEYVLDCIRNVNPSMVVRALDRCDINELGDYTNNEEILKHMKMKFNSK